ncbi:hypothetical protein RvY_12548 [Ramazzottius varieornatus]|uniref:SANTA domain-containing protein n=1 Tax=Ramazzottius varieornatus TaxID=947166 RepID=A0A1D1VP26_RAMVA|nr:hypothetical protein RvY_12548 [Ramazzottius varieornatus]
MALPIARGGTMDLNGGRPAPARKVQPVKKAVNVALAQVAAPNLVAVAEPRCNHEIYGVKADLWEWVIEFTPDGAVRVVGQDQQGGPGLIVKKITTTTIKERIQGKKDFVVTQSNSIYRLIGKLWLPEMIENGFSQRIMDAFRDGFPKNWASLLQEEWKRQEEVKKSRNPESLQQKQPKAYIRGTIIPHPKPVAPVVEAPPVEIPSPAWETWEEEDDENRREKDFPRDSYQAGGLPRLPAVPLRPATAQVDPATIEAEPEELIASTMKPESLAERTEAAENVEASTEEQTGTVVTSSNPSNQKARVEEETQKEVMVEQEKRDETGDVPTSPDLTEVEADLSLAQADKTVDVNDLEAMLALESSAIRAAVGLANKSKEVAAGVEESVAPSTSTSSSEVPSTSHQASRANYELRRRYDVCYNYEVNQSAAKKQRKNGKGPKSNEKHQSHKKAASEEVQSGLKLDTLLAVMKRQSETDVVETLAVGPEVGPEVKVFASTKRQRCRSSPPSPTTLRPVLSSAPEPPTPHDEDEEKYQVELEWDSLERMTGNQHREVFPAGRKDGSGRKGTPTKVVLSGFKGRSLSPPARISMSAPLIVKKFSAQKDKKLRGLFSAERQAVSNSDMSTQRLQGKLAKEPRRGTPHFKSEETIPIPAIPSPHVRSQPGPLMYGHDDVEGEVDEGEKVVEAKKLAARKKVLKKAKAPKSKKTTNAVAEEEEKVDFSSVYNLAKNTDDVGRTKKKISRSRIRSPETPVVKPRLTQAPSSKGSSIAPKPYNIPAVTHSIKKTKKGKRRSIVPVRAGRRNANWFEQTVEGFSTIKTVSSSEKKKATAGLLFKKRESSSRKSSKLSLGAVEWEDEEEIDFQPKQTVQTNKLFRMSMGKATRRPQPRRDTCYDPSNNTDAIRRQNFQGFMKQEKTNKGERGLRRHGNVSDLRQVSPQKHLGMPSKLPVAGDEDSTEEDEPQSDEEF